MEINIKQAKNDLSKLIVAAQHGEEVIITNHGKPVAEIVVKGRCKPGRGYGCAKGEAVLHPGWDSRETDDEIAKMFEE